MRRWFIYFLVSFNLIFLWPAIAGCAKGGESFSRRRDGGSATTFDMLDARSPPSATDAFRPSDIAVSVDAATRPVDAFVPRTPMRESCNGTDDDLDTRVDEDFLCPLGRMGGDLCHELRRQRLSRMRSANLLLEHLLPHLRRDLWRHARQRLQWSRRRKL
jgi:hypothetical protein